VKSLRDFGNALSLLTVLPSDAEWTEDTGGVAGWFPAVGLLVGGLVFLGVQLLRLIGWDGRASLVVAAYALLTRLLHWDGLADVADGWWGGSTAAERLAIMRDSRIGAFGAAAIGLALAVQLAAVQSVLVSGADVVLIIAPAISRLSASSAAWFGTPARTGGLGASVSHTPSPASLIPSALVEIALLTGGFVAFGWPGVAFVVAGEAVAFVVPHLMSRRFGGVTGDTMGASVLVTESLLLAAAAFIWGA
jgi:adenosylcobinamide-GDP ribazoletransferase